MELNNIEWAEKHLSLQKEYNQALKDAIEREMKYGTARDLLEEAATQIEYLHKKFTATGSGNNVLSRIKTFLDGK